MIAANATDDEIIAATTATYGKASSSPKKFTRTDLKRLRERVQRGAVNIAAAGNMLVKEGVGEVAIGSPGPDLKRRTGDLIGSAVFKDQLCLECGGQHNGLPCPQNAVTA